MSSTYLNLQYEAIQLLITFLLWSMMEQDNPDQQTEEKDSEDF